MQIGIGLRQRPASADIPIEQQIANIFATADGAWYDPRTATSLFQDNTGITPTGAAGNVVGLMEDVKHSLALGPELASGAWVNGSMPFDVFAANPTGFTATKSVAGTMQQAYFGSFAVQSGKAYVISVEIPANTFAANQLQIVFSVATTQRSTNAIGTVYSGGYTPRTFSGILFSSFTGTVSLRISTLTPALGSVTVGASSVKQLLGNHAAQASSSLKPKYQTGPQRIVYDSVDDLMVTTFPTALGANCTVVRSVPGVGAVILTGQNIGTTYTHDQDQCGKLLINRALTAAETTSVTQWANSRSV